MLDTEKISILHLSDLHYESPDSNYDDEDKSRTPLSVRSSVFSSLHRILQDCIPSNTVDVVALTGDITTRGKPGGFTTFQDQTVVLLKRLLRNPKAFCVVPGNHDVKWGLDPARSDYFDVKFEGYRGLMRKIGGTGALVPRGPLGPDPVPISFVAGRPLYVDTAKRLVVLCVNSSIRCGEVNAALRETISSPIKEALTEVRAAEKSFTEDPRSRSAWKHLKVDLEECLRVVKEETLFDVAHVTRPQLDQLDDCLNRARVKLGRYWSTCAKIALLHHHLVPFECEVPEYKSFASTADAADLLGLLGRFGFQLVLTGHKHQPYIQEVSFGGSALLIVGGATVGGRSVLGPKGIRYIQLQRQASGTVVRIADLACDSHGDIIAKAREQIEASKKFILAGPRSNSSTTFPEWIESAIQRQLYEQEFYRSNVVFTIHAREVSSRGILVLTTVLSYAIVNRTESKQECLINFTFDEDNGEIVRAKFNGRAYDPLQPESRDARGLCMRAELGPGQVGQVYIKAKERWVIPNAMLCTSFQPATDLKVVLRSDAPNVKFDFEPLYKWDVTCDQRREGDALVARFTRGVLPNQGVRVNWKR